jgi:outer membrane lipoprotein carrier protein
MKNFSLLLPLILFFSTALAGPDASRSAETLISLLNQTSRLSADFTQKIYDESGHLIDQSSGKLSLAKPDRFRWEVLKPMKQLVVSNSHQIWIYDPDLAQVIIKPVDKAVNAAPLAILSGATEALTKDFKINRIKEGYQLTSQVEDLNFDRIQLWFKDGKISAMILFDNLGQKTELIFSNLSLNPILSKETFEFVSPKGVDVIDTRER